MILNSPQPINPLNNSFTRPIAVVLAHAGAWLVTALALDSLRISSHNFAKTISLAFFSVSICCIAEKICSQLFEVSWQSETISNLESYLCFFSLEAAGIWILYAIVEASRAAATLAAPGPAPVAPVLTHDEVDTNL